MRRLLTIALLAVPLAACGSSEPATPHVRTPAEQVTFDNKVEALKKQQAIEAAPTGEELVAEWEAEKTGPNRGATWTSCALRSTAASRS